MASPHAVLSLLGNRPVDGLVDNHRGYATLHGYTHRLVDSLHVWGPRQPTLFRYHAIYHELLKRPPDGLLLVLDQFAVAYGGQPLDLLMDGRDHLVGAQSSNDALCSTSMLVLRNTPTERERLRRLILDVAKWAMRIGDDVDAPEALLLGRFYTPQPARTTLPNGITANVQANWPSAHYYDQLDALRPFAANDAPSWFQSNGRWECDLTFDFRGVLNLVQDVAATRTGQPPPWRSIAALELPAEPAELHLNPDAPIAFVSLYTHHVASYGRIHAANLARYCGRHGYGYHLYRGVPAFVPEGIPGSWAKAHVMQRHLQAHAFVFWIDADVLAVDQSVRMEPLIEGRDTLVSTDHTAWPMTSSMVGVRNTPAMHALVEDVRHRIELADDRSTVHANGGDQTYFTWAFDERGLITEACVIDSLSLDASPIYATRHSHLVHFPTQFNPFRAASMALWERWSLENDVPPPA